MKCSEIDEILVKNMCYNPKPWNEIGTTTEWIMLWVITDMGFAAAQNILHLDKLYEGL